MKREELEQERDYLREEVNVAMNFGRIVGKSQALRRMLKRVEAVAETPASVLVQGESGTELLIPAIESVILAIDLEHHQLQVRLLPGLLPDE